jgi:hypothetical protein
VSPFTADQLVAHAIGDYLLQNNWMARRKTGSFLAAMVHACAYTVPFPLLCSEASWWAGQAILWSHAVIDRWGLGRKLKPMPAEAPESLRI